MRVTCPALALFVWAALSGIVVAQGVTPPEVQLGRMDRSYGVLEGTFILKNTNNFPIADASIWCSITAPSGTVIGSYQFTIYEIIPAKGRKTIQNYKFGLWPEQGKSIGCYSASARRA
jgi:hypothetical protein